MTEQRVRELLTEVADAVPPPDAAERAWRRSARVRRRRVAGTALLAVGVVVAAIGAVGVLHDGAGTLPNPDGDRGSAQVAIQPPEAAVARPADARLKGGGMAWIGPTIEEDELLPAAASAALPASIDLNEDIEATEQPGRSMAAFAASDAENQLEEVMLLNRDGLVSRLDVSGLDLDTVLKPDGDDPDSADEYVLPLNISSLSPDGKQLVLAQDHEVVLYNLVTGDEKTWETEDSESYYVGWTYTDRWMIQLPRDLLDPATGEVDPRSSNGSEDSEDSDGIVAIWPERMYGDQTAQAFLGRTVPALGPEIGDDPVLIEVTGPRHALLALPGDEDDNRLRPRSRVVAWLGDDTVAFQSQDYGSYRVLGWDTDSGAVSMLSEVDLPHDWDQGVIASWADIPQ